MSLALKNPFGIRSKWSFCPFFAGHPLARLPVHSGMRITSVAVRANCPGNCTGAGYRANERPELFNEGSYSPATRSEDLYVYPIYSPLSLVDASLNDRMPIGSMRCFMTIVTFWQPI